MSEKFVMSAAHCLCLDGRCRGRKRRAKDFVITAGTKFKDYFSARNAVGFQQSRVQVIYEHIGKELYKFNK